MAKAPSELPETLMFGMPIPRELFMQLLRESIDRLARETDVWITFEQAAAYLHCSPRTLKRYKAKWGLPVVPDLDLILKADLDAVLRSRMARPVSKPLIEFPSLQHGKAAA